MKTLKYLFERNLAWATEVKEKDPEFFQEVEWDWNLILKDVCEVMPFEVELVPSLLPN